MAGPAGVGYVWADGVWQAETRLPAGLDRVDLLADGVLAVTAQTEPHRLYLGTGQADRRNWTEIVVEVE